MAMTATAPVEVAAPAGRVTPAGRTELHRLGAKVRPTSFAGEHLLPVTPALQAILPAGGLQRGSTVVVDSRQSSGATTLAFELLAGPSVGGYWCAVGGFSEMGALAAAERGIDLARLVIVPFLGSPDRWLQVLATLFDSVDAVLFAPRAAVRQSDARRLAARSRDRGSVLIVLDHQGHWSGPSDLRCTVTGSQWSGLSRGHGLLASRRYELEVSGRGAAARPRRAPLQLPA
ncbi:MAG: hypothetical protein ABSH30_08570 [Acidimicrobiales bacterium]|jgi:hypothetical protein